MSGFIFRDENQDEHLEILRDFAYSIALRIPVFDNPPTDIAIGNLYYNLSDNKLYVSTGTSVSDWHPIALEYPSLDSIGSLSTSGGEMLYTTATNTFATCPITAVGRSFLGMSTVSNQQIALNLRPGVNVQAYSAVLDALIAVCSSNDKIVYTSGGNFSTASISSFIRDSVLNASSASVLRANLGLDYLPPTNVDLSGDTLVGVSATQTLQFKTIDTVSGDNTLVLGPGTTLAGIAFSEAGTPADGDVLTIVSGSARWAAPGGITGMTGSPNYWSTRLVTSDTVFGNDAETSSTLTLDTSGLTSGRTVVIPDSSGTVALLGATGTFTNKVLTSESNNITASGLFADGGSTTIDVRSSSGPTGGQVLTITGPNSAEWLTPECVYEPSRTIHVYTGAPNVDPYYTTIAAALEAATALSPSATSPIIIEVSPGTYTEVCPLVVPAFVSIVSTSNSVPGSVIVRPESSGTPIFTLNGNARLAGLFINGETSPGSGVYATIGINCARTSVSTADVVNFCTIFNCTTAGMRVSGNGTLFSKICSCTNLSVQTTVSSFTMAAGIEVCSGGLLLGTNVSVTGFLSATSVITIGIYTHDDYSFTDLNVVQIILAKYGLVTGTGVTSNLMKAYPVLRIIGASLGQIGSYAAGFLDGIAIWMREKSVVRISEVRINEDIQPIAAHYYSDNPAKPAEPNFLATMWMNARLDRVNILGGDITNLPIMRGSNLSEIPNNVINQFGGDVSVGMPSYGANFVSGEGASHIMGMWVFTVTGGVATDRSTAGKLLDGTTFPAFGSTAVDSCLYITGNPALGKLPGLKIAYTVAFAGTSDVRDVIAWEYWNGTAWADMPLMATLDSAPYYSRGNRTFCAEDDIPIVPGNLLFNYRFSRFDDWATALAATLSIPIPAGMTNIPRYWLRARVKAAGMTTIPVIDHVRFRANATKITSDGFTEHFGKGRVKRILPLSCTETVGSGDPSSAVVYASTNLRTCPGLNVFGNSSTERAGYVVEIPGDIDTSDYLSIIIRWTNSEVNNTVVWKCTYGWTSDYTVDPDTASNVHTSIPDPAITERTVTVDALAAPSVGKLNTSILHVDVQTFIAKRGEPGTGDLFWFSISRVPSSNNGNATIVHVSASYTSWY